ncbi:MAG: DMT family transporter [Patescibacteria group bacterium]
MFGKNLPKNLTLAYIALTGATILWGAANPIIKLTLGYIPPVTFLFLRFLIACVILLPYVLYELQKTKIDKRDYLNIFLFGLFSQTSLILIFIGLEYTTVIEASIIGILGSILAVAAGHYFYKDKVNKDVKKGLVIASLGTLFIVIEPLFTGNIHNTNLIERTFGNFLVLLYNITWVIFIVWSKFSMGEERSSLLKKALSFIHLKPMSKNYSSTLLTALALFVGLATITPLALLENMGYIGNISTFDVFSIRPIGLIGLFYMAICSSIIAYMMYQWSLKYVKVSDTAFFGYLAPVLTLPFSYIILKEVPTTLMLIGTAVIGIGVYTSEKNLNDR